MIIPPLELISEAFNEDIEANAQLSDLLEENGFQRTPSDRYEQYLAEVAKKYLAYYEDTKYPSEEERFDALTLDRAGLMQYHWSQIPKDLKMETVKSTWLDYALGRMPAYNNRHYSVDSLKKLCFYHDLAYKINDVANSRHFSLENDFELYW